MSQAEGPESAGETALSASRAAPGAAHDAENAAAADLQDPDLIAVVRAWPGLPPALRAGIVAMIAAAGKAV